MKKRKTCLTPASYQTFLCSPSAAKNIRRVVYTCSLHQTCNTTTSQNIVWVITSPFFAKSITLLSVLVSLDPSTTHDQMITSFFLKYFSQLALGTPSPLVFPLTLTGHTFSVSFTRSSSSFWLVSPQRISIPSLELVSSPSVHSLGGII